MSRRNEKIIDDLFHVIAQLPWWVGIAAAIVSYAVLRHFAIQPPPVPASMPPPHARRRQHRST